MSDFHDRRLRRWKRNPVFAFHYYVARVRLWWRRP